MASRSPNALRSADLTSLTHHSAFARKVSASVSTWTLTIPRGDYFAEVLLLDQATAAAKARAELDWSPSHAGLVDDFRHGSYRKVTAA